MTDKGVNMNTQQIKIKLCTNNGSVITDETVLNKHIPSKGTDGAAGYDVRAMISNENGSILIEPGETIAIPTGIYMSMPRGMACLVLPRSGLSYSTMLRVSNSPGLIDSDYRGEVKILLTNTSSNMRYTIENGERIAQFMFINHCDISYEVVADLDATKRGDGGFGSTGVN